MAKIKDPPITLAPSYQVPGISVTQKGVAKAPPPRVIPSGKRILAQAYGEMGQAIGDVAKYTAMREIATRDNVDSVEASDRLADLKNDLNQHYINNIAPLRGGKAKDIFKHEIETMAGMKEVFLKEVEGNKRLHDALSIEFDSVTQDHLQKVFKHKLTQDANYARDTALKVAKTLQSEMSTLTLKESPKAIDISNQLNEQLAEYPELREAAKITAWKGMFKFNARVDPELAQVAYENPTMKKSIVKQIGFEGYSVIQEAIDKGRAIGIQDKALEKAYAKEVEDERIELNMSDAMHLFFTEPGKFNANYIDTLKVPSTQKRILNGLLSSVTKKKLQEIEVDWPTYRFHLEQVRQAKALGLNAIEVGDAIIEDTNREITVEQGQSLLKALASRDVFDNPVVSSSYDELDRMRRNGEFSSDEGENYMRYTRAANDLNGEVLKVQGDPKKVQAYMDDILIPFVRKSFLKSTFEDLGVLKRTPYIRPKPSATGPYMTDQQMDEIDFALEKAGHNLTVDQLTDEDKQIWLDYIKTPEYKQIGK